MNITPVDVYDDSPTIVTAWLTIMPKISILIFLLQLLIGIDDYLNFNTFSNVSNFLSGYGTQLSSAHYIESSTLLGMGPDALLKYQAQGGAPVNVLTNLLLLSSLLSLIIGAIVGLSQIRIKRLLAYIELWA